MRHYRGIMGLTSKLRFIGAAFPRTGTMSVKIALETLGIGKCYHMYEVFLHPGIYRFGRLRVKAKVTLIGAYSSPIMRRLSTVQHAGIGNSLRAFILKRKSSYSCEIRRTGTRASSEIANRYADH